MQKPGSNVAYLAALHDVISLLSHNTQEHQPPVELLSGLGPPTSITNSENVQWSFLQACRMGAFSQLRIPLLRCVQVCVTLTKIKQQSWNK